VHPAINLKNNAIYQFQTLFAINPGKTDNVVIASNRNLWESNDRGATWVAQSIGAPPGVYCECPDPNPDAVITAFAFSPRNSDAANGWGNTIFEAFSDGTIWQFRRGGTPEWVQLSNPWGAATVSKIAVDPGNSDVAYVSLNQFGLSQIWRTSNNGSRWNPINGALPNVPVETLLWANAHTLYAGTDMGVYRGTETAGAWAWNRYDTGMPSVMVTDLQMQGTLLVAGTYGRGVWATSIPAGMAQGTEATPAAGTVVQFTDQTGAPLGNYTAAINWGDGSAVDFTSGQFSESGTTVSVTGSHTFAAPGLYTVTVQIDKHDGTAPITLQTTIDVADAPLTANPQNFGAAANTALTNQLVATFSDANPVGDNTDYVATIDWGDGTTSAGSITANPDGTFNVVGSHTYLDAGSFPVSVEICDGGEATVHTVGTATVSGELSATAVLVQGTENTAFYGVPLATFTSSVAGASPGDFSAGIQWGDGQAGSGTVTQNADGSFTVSGSHTYVAGAYTATITIQANDGASATITTQVSIADAALTVTGIGQSGTAGVELTGVNLASFTDADPATAAANFTAYIDWGDSDSEGSGNLDQGTIVQQADGSFVVQGTHTYAAAGTYAVTVYVEDDAGSYAAVSDAISVAHADSTITLADTPNPSVAGQDVTITATVAPAASNSLTPTGLVTFYSDNNAIGTAYLDGTGCATIDISSLSAGSHSITATYAGDDAFNGSSASAVTQVVKNATATSVSSSMNPASVGSWDTFTAYVTVPPPGSGTPTGTVRFYCDGALLGTANVSGGNASFATAGLTAGSHTILAVYSGDSNFGGSSASLNLTVNQGQAFVSVQAAPSSVSVGQSFNIDVSVTGSQSGSVVPTGSVEITVTDSQNNVIDLGSFTLDSSGHVTLTTSIAAAGYYYIAATYSGDGNYLSSLPGGTFVTVS
jgi:hypothetical protein